MTATINIKKLTSLLNEEGSNSFVLEFENTGASTLRAYEEVSQVYRNVKLSLTELITVLEEMGFTYADTDEDYLYDTDLELHRFQPTEKVHFPRG